MPNSPVNPQNPNTQKRICDFCSESTALLYCRADSAKLCFSCDIEVHSTNPLFTKHKRFQLCDGCDSAPASIFCVTEHSVLCQNCDFEIHKFSPNSTAHDRRPLEGFCGCPSVQELSGFVGFEGFDSKCVEINNGDREKLGFDGGGSGGLDEENNDGFSDYFEWDTPAVVSIDELISSTDKSHSFQAMVVPPMPKDRNLSCGQHKQEILNQLHKLVKSEPYAREDYRPLVGFSNVADEDEKDSAIRNVYETNLHDEEHATLQGLEAGSFTWGSDAGEATNDVYVSCDLSGSHNEDSFLNLDTHSSMCSSANLGGKGCNPLNLVGTEHSSVPPKMAAHEFNSAERDSALSRYKEKKRTRRYEKHIRYESRKVQAKHRTRIKGRFAKIDHNTKKA